MLNKKLKFIHIPRTGGTTIENCGKDHGYEFGRFDGIYCHNIDKTSLDIFGKKPPLWHSKLDNNKTLIQNFVFFGIIRNPVDRLISEYYRPDIEYHTSKITVDNSLAEKLNESQEKFNETIFYILNLCKIKPDSCGHFSPQTNHLSTDRSDYLLVFDNLVNLSHQLFNIYQMNIKIDKHDGSAINKKYNHKHLSYENLLLIQEVYSKDIELYIKLVSYYQDNTSIFLTNYE